MTRDSTEFRKFNSFLHIVFSDICIVLLEEKDKFLHSNNLEICDSVIDILILWKPSLRLW